MSKQKPSKCPSCNSAKEIINTRFSEFLVDVEYLCGTCNAEWETFVDSFLKQDKDEMWVRSNIYADPYNFLRAKKI